MRFLWHRQTPPLETRLRDLFGENSATAGGAQTTPAADLTDQELAGLALQRVSNLRELPAARLEAIGRRGFARSAPRPSMVALRWSLTTLATVLALNLAVAAALAGIDRFGPRISQLLAADHARLAAGAAAPSNSSKAQAPDEGLAKVGHLLWVERDPQQALAAFVAFVQHSPKAQAENAVLANEAGIGRDSDLTRAEQMRDGDRCVEAVRVFEKVLAASPESTEVRERASFGRAQCLGQTGDAAGAKAELHRYLLSFPKGRFAADARRALSE